MNPERKVEILLYNWLKNKGDNIKEVYFNSKNEINAPVFKVSGDQSKPDFIIKININSNDEYCVVEIKDNSKSRNVKDSDKILNLYMKKYLEKYTSYVINEKQIKIKYFLVATQDSLNGKLYNKRDSLIDNYLDSKKKYLSETLKLIPRYEGQRTYDFVRQLFRCHCDIRKNYEEKCPVGILIADVNNNSVPAMFIVDYNQIKKRWCQKWRML